MINDNFLSATFAVNTIAKYDRTSESVRPRMPFCTRSSEQPVIPVMSRGNTSKPPPGKGMMLVTSAAGVYRHAIALGERSEAAIAVVRTKGLINFFIILLICQ